MAGMERWSFNSTSDLRARMRALLALLIQHFQKSGHSRAGLYQGIPGKAGSHRVRVVQRADQVGDDGFLPDAWQAQEPPPGAPLPTGLSGKWRVSRLRSAAIRPGLRTAHQRWSGSAKSAASRSAGRTSRPARSSAGTAAFGAAFIAAQQVCQQGLRYVHPTLT